VVTRTDLHRCCVRYYADLALYSYTDSGCLNVNDNFCEQNCSITVSYAHMCHILLAVHYDFCAAAFTQCKHCTLSSNFAVAHEQPQTSNRLTIDLVSFGCVVSVTTLALYLMRQMFMHAALQPQIAYILLNFSPLGQ